MKARFLILSIFTLLTGNLLAASFTWNGSNSTNWATAANWTPSGVPSTNDTVTVVSATRSLLLDANRTVKRFTMTSGTLDLNSDTLTISTLSSFTAGTISNGLLKIQGTTATFQGTIFNCAINAICGQIKFNGSKFNTASTFEQNGSATGTGTGGNVFNADVTIKNSGTAYLSLSTAATDTFNAKATLIQTGSLWIQVAHGYPTIFNGNVEVNCTGANGIAFTSAGIGGAVLASGKTISVGSTGFSAGTLLMRKFSQAGSTAQTLTLTGTATISLDSTTFNGALTLSVPNFLSKYTKYYGSTSITKSSTTSNFSDGGNHFYADVTINNTASSTASLRSAVVKGDLFDGNLTCTTTSGQIQLSYFDTTDIKGNLSINHATKITFNNSSGTLRFTGSSNQTIGGSAAYSIGKIIINKSNGTVTLNQPVTIDSSATFVKGILYTTATNLLTLKASCTASSASIASYVDGPLKKIGNAAFNFPVGKGNDFRPVGITAPSSVTDAFTAEFFSAQQSLGFAHSSTINYLSNCSYWNLSRTNGTSNVQVTLNWSKASCDVFELTSQHIAEWDGTQWNDLGSISLSGNDTIGSAKTINSVAVFGNFLLSYDLQPIVNFEMNIDSSTTPSIVTFSNLSTGFTKQAKYIWKYGDFCTGDTIGNIINFDAICFDTIPKHINNIHFYYYNTIYPITLKVIDNNSIYSYTDSINLNKSISNSIQCEYVKNNHFTEYDYCPPTPLNLGFMNGSYATKDWYTANWTNPDFLIATNCTVSPTYFPYYSCTSPCYMPNAPFSCHGSADNAAIGLSEYRIGGSWNEIIQSPLKATLQNGQAYLIQFHASTCEAEAFDVELQVALHPNAVTNYANAGGLGLTPVFTTNGPVTSTAWTYYSNASNPYIANGTEDHISIGNFNLHPLQSQKVPLNCGSTGLIVSNYGCALIDDISITPIINIEKPIIEGPIYNCSENKIYTIQNLVNGAPYYWEVKDNTGTTILTSNNTILDLTQLQTNGLTFTIECTTYNATPCALTTIYSVYPCCEGIVNANNTTRTLTFTDIAITDIIADADYSGPAAFYYKSGGGPTAPFSISSLSTTNVPIPLAINGTLTVDHDIAFLASEILMGPNAKIIVLPGIKLVFANKVHIHSCGNYMWDGIYLQGTGSVFKSEETYIEDAQNAIVANNGSKCIIRNTTIFNKNYRSVVIQNATDYEGIISSALFECIDNVLVNGTWVLTNSTNKDLIGLQPHNGVRSYSGVEIVNSTLGSGNQIVEVGSETYEDVEGWPDASCNFYNPTSHYMAPPCIGNKFYNLDYGVFITNSDVSILGNEFEDIYDWNSNTSNSSQVGSAISCSGNRLNLRRLIVGDINTPSPQNNTLGNTFLNCKKGINITGGRCSLTATYNTFTNVYYSGIDIRRTGESPSVISDNHFYECNRGINMTNMTYSNGSSVSTASHLIESNIYSFNGTLSIPSNPPQFPNIVKWFLNVENAPSNTGINAITIQNNVVSGAWTGIRANLVNGLYKFTPSFKIYNNEIILASFNYQTYGIRLLSCANTIIDHNTIYKPNTLSTNAWPYAISLESCLPNNLIQDNLLEFAGTGIRAFNTISPNTLSCNALDNNLFGIRFEASDLGDQGSTTSPQDNQWYLAYSYQTSAFRTGAGSVPLRQYFHRNGNNAIYANSAQTPGGQTRPILFQGLNNPPSSACNNPCIGAGCRVVYFTSIITEDSIYQNMSSTQKYMAKQNVFIAIKEDSSFMNLSLPTDSLFTVFFDSMSNSNSGKIYDIVEYLKVQDTISAKLLLSSLTATTEPEYYLKKVNEIYSNTWASDIYSLDSIQTSELSNIAYLNPYLGGLAVYAARALLDIDLNDSLDSDPNLRIRPIDNTVNTSDLVDFTVYPNPAEDEVEINFINLANEKVNLEVRNAVGSLVLSKRNSLVIGNMLKLDVSQLSSGVYFIYVFNPHLSFKIKQLVIIK